MAASEAQIRANRSNGAKSQGAVTPEGRAASSANSLKHGLTATKLLPELEAAEVQRRFKTFVAELNPSGEVGLAFVLRAATMSVRMERCVAYENARLAERVRQAVEAIEYPEGIDAAGVAGIRAEVGARAAFDPSPEATLARKYEAAAERSFFKSLKELQQHERRIKAAEDEEMGEESGSFLPDEMTDEEFDKLRDEVTLPEPRKPVATAAPVDCANLNGRIDAPFTVGKRR